jgi:hypothetical protein
MILIVLNMWCSKILKCKIFDTFWLLIMMGSKYKTLKRTTSFSYEQYTIKDFDPCP